MKILESQNAVLSNYEVYTHLVESKARFAERQKKDHRRPPKNYQIVTKDVRKLTVRLAIGYEGLTRGIVLDTNKKKR